MCIVMFRPSNYICFVLCIAALISRVFFGIRDAVLMVSHFAWRAHTKTTYTMICVSGTECVAATAAAAGTPTTAPLYRLHSPFPPGGISHGERAR